MIFSFRLGYGLWSQLRAPALGRSRYGRGKAYPVLFFSFLFMLLHELRKLQLKGLFITGVGNVVEGCVSDPNRE